MSKEAVFQQEIETEIDVYSRRQILQKMYKRNPTGIPR